MSNNPFLSPQAFRSPDPMSNPFVPDAQYRYPALPQEPNYPQQQQQFQQQSWAPQVSSPSSPVGYNPNFNTLQGGRPYPTPFQPTSSFGQQMHQQMTGMPPSSGSGFSSFQNTRSSPLIQSFDPYAGIGQGWSGISPQPTSPSTSNGNSFQSQGQPGMPHQQPSSFQSFHQPQQALQQLQGLPPSYSSSIGGGGSRTEHPRTVVQSYKSELERWDPYAWKQVLNACDSLKHAWEARRDEISAAMRTYGGNDPNLQNLLREANSHIDTIAASSFQLQEVQTGYRESADFASKRRVRESINAGLRNLPEWP